jgi:hypothetical protein
MSQKKQLGARQKESTEQRAALLLCAGESFGSSWYAAWQRYRCTRTLMRKHCQPDARRTNTARRIQKSDY